MAHFVTGLVAEHAALAQFARDHALEAPAPLARGLAFLPVDKTLAGPDPIPDFKHLTAQLIAMLERTRFDVAYIETEYFGGDGDQGAIAFHDGRMAYGPHRGGIGIINQALGQIGVSADGALDAFEAAGLYKFRSNDDVRR